MSPERIVALRDLTFAYDSALEPILSGLTVSFPHGFTAIVGANGAGKTTLLQLITGTLQPRSGTIQGAENAIYCEQRTDDPPEGVRAFMEDWDSEAFDLRRRLGIEPEFLDRWDTLSHGERKRTQIAYALWQQPDLLAIDEPTNHIDAHARRLLMSALKRFRGVGLIVSHDRELLDELCVQCLWLEPPNALAIAGGYTQASEQREHDTETAIRVRKKAVREHKKLKSEIVRRREKAEREHKNRSKRGIAPKDHDAKAKIDAARVADSKAGQPLRQLAGKAARSEARLEAARVDKQYETGIWLPGSRSKRDTLFRLEEGEMSLGADRVLRFPSLAMLPDDRIAITGVNGSGKSTLVQHILQHVTVPPDRLVVMPQELTAVEAAQILDDARALKREPLGHLMTVVSRLGSRPQRLLDSQQPSPGEVRKLLLALGMARAPHLIVMDEPTNHLDLPSIEALESALAECPCGLLLVSHDQRFLDQLADKRWHIESDEIGNSTVFVQ